LLPHGTNVHDRGQFVQRNRPEVQENGRAHQDITIMSWAPPVPGVDVMAKRSQGLLNVGDSFRADGGAAFLRS
jgi:hypothetical protein